MNDNFYKKYIKLIDFHKEKFSTEDPLSTIIIQINRINKKLEEENLSEEEAEQLLGIKKSFELHRNIIVRVFDSVHFLGFMSN